MPHPRLPGCLICNCDVLKFAGNAQVVTRFFVSHDGKDANMTGELHLENEEHGDMVILGPNALGPGVEVLDGIPGVTQKMFILFEMAVTAFEPQYVARIDDDSYVNIPVIMHMLARNLSDRPFWFGYTIHGAQIDHRANDGLSLLKYQSYVDDLIHPPIVPQYMNGASSSSRPLPWRPWSPSTTLWACACCGTMTWPSGCGWGAST